MWTVWVGLLGCALGAQGRDIPVYREYTQPILFYDEQGVPQEFHTLGLDMSIRRSLRDARAQDGLLGPETIFDLTLTPGASVFGKQAPVPGKMTPVADGRPERRRTQEESSRNWLAKSLSLPSLGQTPTNAAASVISAGAKESSWGWLADEVAGQSGEVALLPEELQGQAEYDSMVASDPALAEGNNPFATERTTASGEKTKQEAVTAASFPEHADLGQKPSERATERNEASVRDLEGGDRTASPTMKDYRASAPVAEMSQTRKMIAELSAGARLDLSSFQAAAIAAPTDSENRREPTLTGRESPNFSASSGGTTGWGALGNRPGLDSSSMRAPAPVNASWQGGWRAQNDGPGGLVLSRGENPPISAPVAVTPVEPPGRTRAGPASGGYKPAWF